MYPRAHPPNADHHHNRRHQMLHKARFRLFVLCFAVYDGAFRLHCLASTAWAHFQRALGRTVHPGRGKSGWELQGANIQPTFRSTR